jgi:hypothetical protein
MIKRGVLAVIVTCAAGSAALSPARADAPLIDAADRFTSKDGRVFAVPGPKRKTTIVFRKRPGKPPEKLWDMPGWPYAAFLTDDGEFMAVADPRASILPRDYKPDQTVVSFFKRSTLIKAVRLDEVLVDAKSMGSPSESGYTWGWLTGLIASHSFALDTVENRRLVFDVTTGKLTEVIKLSPPRVDRD